MQVGYIGCNGKRSKARKDYDLRLKKKRNKHCLLPSFVHLLVNLLPLEKINKTELTYLTNVLKEEEKT